LKVRPSVNRIPEDLESFENLAPQDRQTQPA